MKFDNKNLIIIIIIVGISALFALLNHIEDIPALCLGGLIGYLSNMQNTTDEDCTNE